MVDVLSSARLRPRIDESTAQGSEAVPVERRATSRKKLTVEVSSDLHRRILRICATRRIPVNQAVRDVLERAFPGG